MTQQFARTTGNVNNSLFCMSRCRAGDGDLIQQSDVSSIAYRVIDIDADDATPATGTLSVASVIFNSPQDSTADSRWPMNAPAEGYNFGGSIPGSAFPDGSTKYFVRINATMSDASIVTLYSGIHNTREDY